MDLKNRHPLNKKQIREIDSVLQKSFNQSFLDKKDVVEIGDFNSKQIILVDQVPCFIEYKEGFVFTIQGVEKFKPSHNYVIVDMGAVGFVTNGADVMAPGIVDADETIEEGDQAWVCDERHKKPLAVGFALCSGEKMKNKNKGKTIKVVHFVGDKVWKSVAKSL
ncbi:MAG: RNA-binding protein [Candidatus Thermoplasmatota archaeon]